MGATKSGCGGGALISRFLLRTSSSSTTARVIIIMMWWGIIVRRLRISRPLSAIALGWLLRSSARKTARRVSSEDWWKKWGGLWWKFLTLSGNTFSTIPSDGNSICHLYWGSTGWSFLPYLRFLLYSSSPPHTSRKSPLLRSPKT